MEAGSNLLSSFSLRSHLRNCPSTSSSVSVLHEQAASAITSVPTTSIARHFPTSVLLQEQRDECRSFLHIIKEDRTSQGTLDRRQMEAEALVHDEKNCDDSDQYLKDFECQLLRSPGLWYLSPSLQTAENTSLALTMQAVTTDTERLMDVKLHEVVNLAKKALSASKEAASLVEDSKVFRADLDKSFPSGLGPTSSGNFLLEEEKTVRSRRRLERRSRKRSVPELKSMVQETSSSRKVDLKRKISEGFDPNDPLRLFLRSPETRQLLTAKEESVLIAHIQDLIKLEEVKASLQSQFNREPTLLEWAEAVGLSCRVLQTQLHSGNRCREKLICANFRMVVHIAKHYQGRGLSLQDLMQEGSLGLMKSVAKFKPQAGCRFATYAYWWIRQSVRKAVFQHSRTIRLPDNVYALLGKITEAKRSFFQEAQRRPTNEELAARVGVTVKRLDSLLLSARTPLSMQQPVWTDQATTFQEITADTQVETPEVMVTKQLMRQHVRNLLSILSPKERRIIRMRFGIEGFKQTSLADIGTGFGLSKERVRQLESRALYKLKQCLGNQGLEDYSSLLF